MAAGVILAFKTVDSAELYTRSYEALGNSCLLGQDTEANGNRRNNGNFNL